MSTTAIVESGLFKTTESVQKAKSTDNNDLGQDEFLMLMLEQIKNHVHKSDVEEPDQESEKNNLHSKLVAV